MADFIFNTKGLTAADRAQWEKDNIDQLNKLGYNDFSDEDKDLAFKKAAFKHKFGSRPDYSDLKLLPLEKKDSLYLSDINDEVLDISLNQQFKQAYEDDYKESISNDGKLIGSLKKQWEDFDKMLDEISPNYYKIYKGTEYFPMDELKKLDLMSTFLADLQTVGELEAIDRMAKRLKTEVSENQPILDKYYRGFFGGVNKFWASQLSFYSSALAVAAAVTGVDRLTGENYKEGYFENIWAAALDNPGTRYFDRVMKEGTWFNQAEDEKDSYNALEVIRTAKEDESLVDNIFSVNTIPELLDQAGFTAGSMVEGAGLSALGNKLFNTAKAYTIAHKASLTIELMEQLNKILGNISKWQRRYNAYVVPSTVGAAEGLLNALETKLTSLEDSNKLIEDSLKGLVLDAVSNAMENVEVPDDIRKSGQAELYLSQIQQQLTELAEQLYVDAYNDAVNRAELDADKAAFCNFIINSFINGWANTVLKAPMFGGKVMEALERSRVGKLFAGNKFTLDNAKNVVAKEISGKEKAWNAAKEMLGELTEEYTQDVSDAFSRGGAENDMSNYIKLRFNGVTDDAITDSLSNNLMAALAAAGKSAVSKEAVQSGIYGALGLFIGTPNFNALTSKSTYSNWKNMSGIEKFNSIYRVPVIDSFLRDSQENKDRKDAAKALNEWLNLGNNKLRLTSLEGALGWSKEMLEGADSGDEYKFRNSRLGKLVSDYFMLELLKGTSLYDAYMQQYMDIINAKEGDEMAQSIAKYDDRPLAEVQKDAQNMLDIMDKVQKATVDLEKSLGKSIPQEAKETLIYGKLSIEDWKERATKLETEILNSYGGGASSSLTDALKKYIARAGKLSEQTPAAKEIDKAIEKVLTKINTLSKNENLLSDSKKEELKQARKKLKDLEKLQKLSSEKYQELIKGAKEDQVLTAADIMNLTPIDRYIMLNPKNREKYSQEQLEVIESLIKEATVNTSDFMNKVEDAARINDAQTIFYEQYNKALNNPDILNSIASKVKYERKVQALEKSYQHLNKINNKDEFLKELNEILENAGETEYMILDRVLKDNEFYKQFNTANDHNLAFLDELQKNPNLKNMSEEERLFTTVILNYLSLKGYDSQSIEGLDALTKDNGEALKQFIGEMNMRDPQNPIGYSKIEDVIAAFLKAVDILLEELTEADKATSVDTRNPSKSSTQADPVVTLDDESDNDKLTDEDDSTNEIMNSILDYLSESPTYGPLLETFSKELELMFESGELSSESSVKEIADVLAQHLFLSDEAQSVASEIINQLTNPLSQKLRIESEKNKELERIQQELKETAVINLMNYNEFDSDTPKAIVDFYEAFDIDTYLRTNYLKSNTKVHIAYLPSIYSLTLGKNGFVALVEDTNGPIEIGGYKYQPIGVLPNSFEGIDKLNDKITDREAPSIIAHTSLNGNVESTYSPMIDRSSPNIPLHIAALMDIPKKMVEGLSENAINSLAEKIMRDTILKIKVSKKQSSNGEYLTLEYEDSDLKGGTAVTSIFVANPWETRNLKGKSLEEVLKSGDVNAILSFNSRLNGGNAFISSYGENIGFLNAIKKFYERNSYRSGDLDSHTNDLNKELSKWIKLSADYSFEIIKTDKIGPNNIPIYQLRVKGPKTIGGIDNSFILGESEGNSINNQWLAEVAKNLFLDEQGKFRTTLYNGNEESVAKWNVDYRNFDLNDSHYKDDAAKADRKNVFYDGLLTISHTRLTRLITRIRVHNPINPQVEKPSTTVANLDNADIDSKSPKLSTELPTNAKPKEDLTIKNTEEKVKEIIEDSKRIIRGATGTRQALGVTSIIKDKFLTSNPLALALGNTVDRIVRNFFNKSLASSYNNVNDENLDSFTKQLEKFRRTELAGYEIISEISYPDGKTDGVRVNGSVTITDLEGNENEVPITGTLDLLVYNPVTGKFRIYDVKTIKNPENMESRKDSWKKQLYLYKKMLEDKYGITIESVHILPVKVTYNDNLEEVEGKLLWKGLEFKGTSPELLETENIDLTNFKFRVLSMYLSDEERNFIKGEMPKGEPKEVKEQDRPKPPIKGNSGLAAPSLLNSSALEDLGLNSNDVLNGDDNLATTKYPYESLTEEEKLGLQELFSEPLEEMWDKIDDSIKEMNLECVRTS